MPVVTTLHPVATKLAKEGTVMHRSPSCISSSQDIALWVWEGSVLFILIFFSADKFKRKLFYSIRSMKISLTFCYKTKNTWKRHAASTGGCFTQAWTAAMVAASLLKGCAFWDGFLHNLVANLGKSCSSKPSQYDCNSSIFTAQAQLLASTGLHPVWLLLLTEKRLQSIFLKILSLYMWPWFATSLQL